MKSRASWVWVMLAAAVPVFAQPVVNTDGVINAASYSLPGLPNSGIAPGSMFIVFGTALGTNSSPATFPLTTTMQGTSIQVTVGQTSVQALMIYTTPTQLAAILPSNTPTGTAQLRVTVNGVASNSASFNVVPNSFGTFTQNQAGSGPAIVQHTFSVTPPPLADVTRPAQIGQTVVLWGTGLGAVTGNEAAGPAPGDLKDQYGVEVFVGNRRATVTYAGRSGCCAGIDQINFILPDNIQGCYVSVAVKAGSVVSNFTTMAIASGPACSDPNGTSSADLAIARTQGFARIGVVDLSRFQLTIPVAGTPLTAKSDSGNAVFGQFSADQLGKTRGVTQSASLGSCAVSVFRGLNPLPVDPIRPGPLDAGAALSATGPKGEKAVPRVLPGIYTGTLGGIALDQLLTGVPIADYLEPGEYTITGAGGAGSSAVGPFSIRTTSPPAITWTNADRIGLIDRSQDLEITWTGGTASDFVMLTGLSTVAGPAGPTATSPGAAFVCVERANAQRFVVPSFVLQTLPAGGASALFPSAFILVGGVNAPVKFSAPGLDQGYVTFRSQAGKPVAFR